MPARPLTTVACRLRTLGRDRSGLALIEFALTLPIVIGIGGWGIECSFLALTNLRVSQFALTLADDASRVGLLGTGGVSQLRESDINDVLQGTRLQGQGIGLTTYGRITLTSLENRQRTDYTDHASDTGPVQRIHWQRCIGAMSGTGYAATYPAVGALPNSAATDLSYANRGVDTSGVGSPAVVAPSGGGVMVAEVSYQYKPLFKGMFLSPTIIHYSASFIVRDNRNFSQVTNPSPSVTPSTCDKFTS